jgi:hypothetical protein
MECIEKILEDVQVGCFFDSHYVVNRMIKKFSDDYLRISLKINHETNNLTLRVHQQIGHLIAAFEGKLVERQTDQSWSLNIHGNYSTCALWKRI